MSLIRDARISRAPAKWSRPLPGRRRDRGVSDRGNSVEKGCPSLDRCDAATGPLRRTWCEAALMQNQPEGQRSMLRIEQVLGSRLDPALAERIHELEHHGAVGLLTVPAADVSRHRFRSTTQGGTEVAIALPRDQRLFDGAVLALEPDHAVVARAAQSAGCGRSRARRHDRARLSRRQSALACAHCRRGPSGRRGSADGRLSRPARRIDP
jgi:hypothetical protein